MTGSKIQRMIQPMKPGWINKHTAERFEAILLTGQENSWTPVLVGGFNPPEKNISQNGNLPQIGVKIKNVWNHHLE